MLVLFRLQPPGHGGRVASNNVEVFARSVGRRNSDRHCSAEYVAPCAPDEFRCLEPPGSLEVYPINGAKVLDNFEEQQIIRVY